MDNFTEKIIPPAEAITLLKAGNKRYVSMNYKDDWHIGPDARKPLLKGQSPYATILCCSDSRVPPEIIFDEGLGRLFIIRIAGNIITHDLVKSLEYAILHTTSRLIMVMGHETCGAVSVAVKTFEDPAHHETSGLNSIINSLMPAIMIVKKDNYNLHGQDLVEAAAKKNVQLVVEQIPKDSKIIHEMQDKEELKIIGSYYYLETGEVDIWD